MTNEKVINFDMDGTLCDFYGVEGWLEDLINENDRPYKVAKPRFNFSAFARRIHKLQAMGYKVNIISWLSKSGSDDFNAKVTATKKAWLKKRLPSVEWDNIIIVAYGTPKHILSSGILFDDEISNRQAWGKGAYDENNILETLKNIA